MGEIRIVGPGKTRGYPYPVCKKTIYTTLISVDLAQYEIFHAKVCDYWLGWLNILTLHTAFTHGIQSSSFIAYSFPSHGILKQKPYKMSLVLRDKSSIETCGY